MGVSQVVEPDSRQSAAERFAVEELADRFGIDGFAVFVREDRIVDSVDPHGTVTAGYVSREQLLIPALVQLLRAAFPAQESEK